MVYNTDVVEGVRDVAQGYDLIVVSSTEQGLFDRFLFGNIPERLAQECLQTTIMVKRYRGPVRPWLRRMILRQ